MGLFKKDEPKVVLPEEVSKYYAEQRRERRGTAIFMGLTALVLTLLIGLGLFFGGRWIYNKISNKDNSGSGQKAPGFDTPSLSGNGGNSSNVAGSGNDDQSSGESSASTESAEPTDVSATSPTADTNSSETTTNSTESMPYTGDEPVTLPRTGDEGH